MATQGKSKRRTKGKTFDLQSFLNEDHQAPDGFAVVTTLNWADCMDDEDSEDKYSFESKNKVILPTVPKSARTPDFDLTKVPTKPPFKAYLGNLPYDVTEDEITRFFKKLRISSVQLIKEGGERGRPRGIGYAVFEDRENLIEALQQNGETIKNRTIRVSLSGDSEVERPKAEEREDRTAGDWRSAPRDDSYSHDSREGRLGRDNMSRNGNDYSSYSNSDSHYMGRSSYDRQDKKGYQRNDYRKYDQPRGYRDNRYQDSRDRDMPSNKRDFGSGFEKRVSNQRFSPSPPVSDSLKREEIRDTPRERPKLQLQKRTKPIEVTNEPASNSAIFGGARPVDTSARDREIEEKLKREQEQVDTEDPSPRSSSQSRRPIRTNKPRSLDYQRKSDE